MNRRLAENFSVFLDALGPVDALSQGAREAMIAAGHEILEFDFLRKKEFRRNENRPLNIGAKAREHEEKRCVEPRDDTVSFATSAGHYGTAAGGRDQRVLECRADVRLYDSGGDSNGPGSFVASERRDFRRIQCDGAFFVVETISKANELDRAARGVGREPVTLSRPHPVVRRI